MTVGRPKEGDISDSRDRRDNREAMQRYSTRRHKGGHMRGTVVTAETEGIVGRLCKETGPRDSREVIGVGR